MPLPPQKIDEVRGRANLVELARALTPLRKQGHNYVGCCPFHQERTPSFSVHAQKNLFYCFGCQAGGDVFAFVMQRDGCDFTTAVGLLAEQVGIVLVKRSPAEERREQAENAVRKTNAAVQQLLYQQLWQPDPQQAAAVAHAKRLRAYLAARGIDAAVAQRFGLGDGGPAGALMHRLTKCGPVCDKGALLQAGLVGEGHGEAFVVGRLTFPIYDARGQLNGFGARRLEPQDAAPATAPPAPKYLNSRESAAFHKNEQLFGLREAMPHVRQRREVLLVEGYLDVLALHQAGAQHAVAALGTQLTRQHALQLKRLADRATLMMDGDKAGLRASFRASQILLQEGFEVQLVPLAAGDDPASLAAERGKQALLALLLRPQPAAAAFVARAFAGQNQSIERRVRAAQRLLPLIDCLTSGLEKTLYTARIAEQVGVDTATLEKHWHEGRQAARAVRRPAGPADAPAARASRTPAAAAPGPDPRAVPRGRPSGSAPAPAIPPHELALVRELLLFPNLFGHLEEVVDLLTAPPLKALLQSLAKQENPRTALPDLLTQCIPSARDRRTLAEVQPFAGKSLDEALLRANRTLADIIRTLRRRAVDDALRRVLGELAEAEGRGQATDALIRRKQQLTAEKRALRDAAPLPPTER